MISHFSSKMPKVNLDLISDETKKNPIFKLIVKRDNSIRATKPKVDKTKPETGKAAYVWRMVCFLVSPKSQHHCMPCTADFDLPESEMTNGKWNTDDVRKMTKDLKHMEDEIVNAIPKDQWHGVRIWHNAFYGS